jgi:hypothetical protein
MKDNKQFLSEQVCWVKFLSLFFATAIFTSPLPFNVESRTHELSKSQYWPNEASEDALQKGFFNTFLEAPAVTTHHYLLNSLFC